MMKKILLIILLLCWASGAGAVTDVSIPGDYSNLKDAVAAVVAGDGSGTITIAAGTYTATNATDWANVVIDSGTINIVGAGSSQTIIDLKHYGRFVKLTGTWQGELQGFTVKNGDIRVRIEVNAVQNSADYTITVDGSNFTYTSDSTATKDEILTGLAALSFAAQPETFATKIWEDAEYGFSTGDGCLQIYFNPYADASTLTVSANLTIVFQTIGNEDGGGIRCYDGTMSSMTDVILYNNTTYVYGGGLAIRENSTTITNCQFINNKAVSSQGGGGGVGTASTGSPVFTNCLFSGNYANQGAGVSVLSSKPVYFTDCDFTGNQAVGYGGAVYVASSATVVIKGCKIYSNLSDAHSPGVYSVGHLSIYSSKIFNNTATSSYGTALRFSGTDKNVYIINTLLYGNTGSTYDLYNTSSGNIYLYNVTGYNQSVRIQSSQTVAIVGCVFYNPTSGTVTSTRSNFIANDVSYTICTECTSGTGNQNVNPLFRDPTNGIYSLQATSPAINIMTAADATTLFTGLPAFDDISGRDCWSGTALEGPCANGVSAGAYEEILYNKTIQYDPNGPAIIMQ